MPFNKLFTFESVLPLIDRDGASVDLRSADSSTPLMMACKYGHASLAFALVERNADVHARDHVDGLNAMMLACIGHHLRCVATLIVAGVADPAALGANHYGATPLMFASLLGHVDVVQMLLREGGACADPSTVNAATPGTGITALVCAAAAGHAQIVHMLLAAGADPNVCASNGWTPVFFAASNGHAQALEVLCNADDVDIDAWDVDRATPLYYAAACGKPEVCQMLLEFGANVNAITVGDRMTPLMAAARAGHAAACMVLLACKKTNVSIKSATKTPGTAMAYAARSGKIEMVRVIRELQLRPRGPQVGDLDREDQIRVVELLKKYKRRRSAPPEDRTPVI